MPIFSLRWANHTDAEQDWMISTGDNFTLHPDHVRTGQVDMITNYVFGIAVTTDGGVAAAELAYTAATQAWVLTSHTPNEWELAVGKGVVTVRCLLKNVNASGQGVEYTAGDPVHDKKDPA